MICLFCRHAIYNKFNYWISSILKCSIKFGCLFITYLISILKMVFSLHAIIVANFKWGTRVIKANWADLDFFCTLLRDAPTKNACIKNRDGTSLLLLVFYPASNAPTVSNLDVTLRGRHTFGEFEHFPSAPLCVWE